MKEKKGFLQETLYFGGEGQRGRKGRVVERQEEEEEGGKKWEVGRNEGGGGVDRC